jgi:hypothetical protein
VSNSQQTSSVQDIRQVEFKAGLGKALRHSGQSDFALMLAMMQQDITQRLKLADDGDDDKPVGLLPIESFNFYPEIPLKTEAQHFVEQEQFARAVHQNDLASAKLMAYMHPTPLSIHNDVKRIDDNVAANCDMFTQMKIKKIQSEDIPVDETLLYESIKEVREKGLD